MYKNRTEQLHKHIEMNRKFVRSDICLKGINAIFHVYNKRNESRGHEYGIYSLSGYNEILQSQGLVCPYNSSGEQPGNLWKWFIFLSPSGLIKTWTPFLCEICITFYVSFQAPNKSLFIIFIKLHLLPLKMNFYTVLTWSNPIWCLKLIIQI